ncbi:MAG TPA: hypothetical protein PKX93_10110, partial [bacterium]|nr:hypothetical protein [bacterium]
KFGQKFLVSGSGGAIFSIFPDETAAQECAASFVRPGWQVKVVPGLNNFVDRRGYGDYRDKSVAG